jgi:hypothetical protein
LGRWNRWDHDDSTTVSWEDQGPDDGRDSLPFMNIVVKAFGVYLAQI